MRILILGPPGSGKTRMAKMLGVETLEATLAEVRGSQLGFLWRALFQESEHFVEGGVAQHLLIRAAEGYKIDVDTLYEVIQQYDLVVVCTYKSSEKEGRFPRHLTETFRTKYLLLVMGMFQGRTPDFKIDDVLYFKKLI